MKWAVFVLFLSMLFCACMEWDGNLQVFQKESKNKDFKKDFKKYKRKKVPNSKNMGTFFQGNLYPRPG
jgi:uncharacterized membrane protein YcaP (DUF421 family)